MTPEDHPCTPRRAPEDMPKKKTGECPYRYGIALSGGGSRGIAHAGALKAIEEAGIKIECIAGVSAGSIVAVMYAAGIKPEEILEMFTNLKFSDLTGFSFDRRALMRLDKFGSFISKSVHPHMWLEDLPIPTYIGVTNLDDGCAEEFHDGPIEAIVKASCCIPIAFVPITINGTRYVDGGVMRNLPAWAIRDKCETLIGVNVSPVERDNKGKGVLDIAMRTYTLMAKTNQYRDMALCDLVVETREISHHQVFSLKEMAKMYNSGYINMRKALRDAGLWHPSPDSKEALHSPSPKPLAEQ